MADFEDEPRHTVLHCWSIRATRREQDRQEAGDLGVEVEPAPACEVGETCRIPLHTTRNAGHKSDAMSFDPTERRAVVTHRGTFRGRHVDVSKERTLVLPVEYAFLKSAELGGRDVRGVARDEVGLPVRGDPALCEGCVEEIALGGLKAVCKTVQSSVLRREGDGLGRQVDAVCSGYRECVEQQEGDAATASAEVEDPGWRCRLQQSCQTTCPLLRLWPRNQGRPPDVEQQGAERLVP